MSQIHKQQGVVRIIGGKWRGRKLTFPAVLGLRPTPDRVRETLFNWLAPYIRGRRCLDLFAGSGALSFEALSRGAKSAVLIDKDSQVVEQLQQYKKLLGATEDMEIIQAQFPAIHLNFAAAFDLVFLDPPFRDNLIHKSSYWLEENHLLADNALIYSECESTLQTLDVPGSWEEIKCRVAGQVSYRLYLRHSQ